MRRAATVGTATLVALTTLLAGCIDGSASTKPPSTPTPTAPSSSPTPEPQTLRFSVYGGRQAVRAYRDIADSYEADHPGVRIVLQPHSDAAAAAEDALADLSTPDPDAASPSGSSPAASAGTTPTPSSPTKALTPSSPTKALTPPDVFLLDQHYLPDLVSTGRLHPLDDELEDKGVEFGDDYQRVALTAFSAESALQCMPFEMSPTVLFVNTRLVRFFRLLDEGIEPPDENGAWRFEDFAATARLVAQESTRPGFRAVYLPRDADLLQALMRTAGGDIVDQGEDPSQLSLDSDAGREALTAYLELARDRSTSLSDRQALRVAPAKRFAQGRLAFLFGTRADVPALRASGVPFDVVSVPRVGKSKATAAAISGLCVDADSPVRDAAVDFVAHAVSETSLTRAARSGALVPASLDVVNSAAFAQRARRPHTVAPFIEGQKRAVLLPYSLAWRQAETRIEELMGRLAAGTQRDLEPELDRLLPAIDEESKAWFDQADTKTGDG
ncbi:hypothetical protein GCM10009815_19320 [Nocardioides marmoribigeumensis]